MLVGDGPHHGAHRQTVEIIVDENEAAQRYRSQLRAHAGFDMCLCPSSEGRRTAGLVHHADHRAQNDKKHQDADVVCIRQHRDDASLKYVQHRALKAEIRIQQAARSNAYKQ